jgi:hypothetical protein
VGGWKQADLPPQHRSRKSNSKAVPVGTQVHHETAVGQFGNQRNHVTLKVSHAQATRAAHGEDVSIAAMPKKSNNRHREMLYDPLKHGRPIYKQPQLSEAADSR